MKIAIECDSLKQRNAIRKIIRPSDSRHYPTSRLLLRINISRGDLQKFYPYELSMADILKSEGWLIYKYHKQTNTLIPSHLFPSSL